MTPRRFFMAFMAVPVAAVVCVYWGALWQPVPPTGIFQRVTCGYERPEADGQASGLMHGTRVDFGGDAGSFIRQTRSFSQSAGGNTHGGRR